MTKKINHWRKMALNKALDGALHSAPQFDVWGYDYGTGIK